MDEDTPTHGSTAVDDAQTAFDFEFGEWRAHISRRLRPLTGSDDWVDYDGSSVVRPVWGGRANLGELDVAGDAGRIEGLSLRVFDPERQEWRIHWCNRSDGILGEAMVGGFQEGVGRFFNREPFEDREVDVRFVFSEITPTTFRLEQAFSDDGRATWEPNWLARFVRT